MSQKTASGLTRRAALKTLTLGGLAAAGAGLGATAAPAQTPDAPRPSPAVPWERPGFRCPS
ncbi:hypothetical protein [Desulfovibrio sp. TomC]|uniref:hypothetical protein n=1 Tax=Desulfovibrio sp. TomC TaxID=1562888 RepID=UPI0005747F44|nr:hypothetical protein [Desulfovibrio sp. TomC]KHK02674.1 hypothetical protein NY78_2031 [Desulfovibrio sp. TomC]